MPVIGAAQLLVRPSFAGFQKETERTLGGVGRKGGEQFGRGFGSSSQNAVGRAFAATGQGLKRTAQITGGTVGGIMALAIQRGFSRLNAIEQAQAKLRGLGHDAQAIQTIMVSALESVRGTAFGLDEAAQAAASAVAAGIKPGQELTKYLKLTADAATIAGSSFNDMSRIINQVTTAGRAQTEDLNQLAERGIPIYSWLAKEYGVTALELRKMVSAGEVDSARFRKAIEDNIGGAALESGNTTTGAFKNMYAAVGRVGANMLSGVFPQFRVAFTAITDALGPVEQKAGVVGQALGSLLEEGVKRLQTDSPRFRGIVQETFSSGRERVEEFWRALVSREGDRFSASLQSIYDSGVKLWPTVRDLARQLFDMRTILPSLSDVVGGLNTALAVVAGTFRFLADHQTAALRVGTVLLTLWAAHRTVLLVNQGVLLAHAAAQGISNAAMAVAVFQYRAIVIGMRVAAIATRAWAAVQWVLNAAMAANPIGLVVLAIAALVAGVILAYKHSETFRAIVQGAWQGIQTAVEYAWTRVIRPAVAGIVAAFTAVGGTIRKVWTGYISPVLQLFGAIIKWLVVKAVQYYLGQAQVAFRALGAAWRWVYQNLVQPTLSAVGSAVRWVWERVIRPAFEAITRAWRSVASGLSSAYDKTIRPMLRALRSGVEALDGVFENAVDAIGKAWGGLKAAARTPVKFVIDVINGLIGSADGSSGFNRLAKKFGTDLMPRLAYPAGLGFARGGIARATPDSPILPGTSSYRDGDSLVTTVRPGEGWVVSEALRDPYERARLLALNKAAVRGETAAQFRRRFDGYGGFFLGGIQPMPGAAWSRHTRGYPWARWAGDGNWPGREDYGAPVVAWKDGVVAAVRALTTSYGKHVRINHDDGRTLYAHLSGFAVRPGQRVTAGQLIGRVGSTGNSSGPHLHFELQGGRNVVDDSGASSGGRILDAIVDWFSDMRDQLKGPLSRLRQLGSSPIAQLAGALPRRLGEMMLAKARGWGSGGISYYADGTSYARRGLAVVGERGPELVNFRGGEQVASNQQQVAALGLGGPVELRGTLDMGNGLRGYVRGIVTEVSDQRDLSAAHRANLPLGR